MNYKAKYEEMQDPFFILAGVLQKLAEIAPDRQM
jgi:hypothetical protein